MNVNLLSLVEKLGEALQNEPAVAEYAAARKAYAEDVGITSAVGEYNVQKMLLENERSQKDGDKALMDSIDSRVKALYEKISASESVRRLTAAESKLNGLLEEVNAKLMSYVEPESECAGDCRSCGGCH